VEILGEHVGEFALPTERDELHRGQAAGRFIAAPGFAECMVQLLNVAQNPLFEFIRQLFVLPDHAAQTANAVAAEDRFEGERLLFGIADAQGFEEQVVRRFVGGLD
jgi:hypothetical protein